MKNITLFLLLFCSFLFALSCTNSYAQSQHNSTQASTFLLNGEVPFAAHIDDVLSALGEPDELDMGGVPPVFANPVAKYGESRLLFDEDHKLLRVEIKDTSLFLELNGVSYTFGDSPQKIADNFPLSYQSKGFAENTHYTHVFIADGPQLWEDFIVFQWQGNQITFIYLYAPI